MNIINLTPHKITLLDESNKVILELESSGVARCTVTRQKIKEINGIPVNRTVFGEVTGLPEPKPKTFYIVSRTVAEAVKDRKDILIVDDTVRDNEGRIIGCKAFATLN